jgi:prephenate dehydrogenase
MKEARGEPVRVAIIGGSGRMGRWFADFLLTDGKEVVLIGRNESKLLEVKRQLDVEVATNVEAVRGADVILISVPIDAFESVVRQVQPYIHSKQVIIDITSIKTFTVETMHKHIKVALTLGVHPMFGPGAKSIANQTFVLTPTSKEERALAEKARGYLEERNARVFMTTRQEHDELMAIILGLSHFIAIVSADTLLSLDRMKQTEALGGPTYKLLRTLVESVISEDAEFYASLQMNLPNMIAIEELFQRSAKAWTELVKGKDQEQFIRKMGFLREKLQKNSPDFGKAYQNMYKIIEEL